MRIVFMGAPGFACPTLSALATAGHEIVAAYTRAPKPAGRRGLELTKTPVHLLAERLSIPVFTPVSLRGEEQWQPFAALRPDVAVVVAYGLILPKPILDAPSCGCFNLHASILPRWRGAAPIQRAIMAGDAETGVSVMQMEEGLDTGPIAIEERVIVAPDLTAGDLTERLAAIGADLLTRALLLLEEHKLVFRAQATDGVAYARKIEKSEARIDWTRGANELRNLIHGLSPSPGAYAEIDLGRGAERIKLLRAAVADETGSPGKIIGEGLVACGQGALRLVEVQRAGRSAVSAKEFWRGLPHDAPARFM